MKKTTTIILIAVIALLAVWAIGGYNSLVGMDEGVSNQWANVETQYQRRADLIPNLVNTVKGYAAHEQETLEGVVEARSKATQIKVDPADLTPEKLAEYQAAQGQLATALGNREAGRIPGRARPTGHRPGQTAGHHRELSRTEGQPELPGAASPTGRHGEPHQRGAQELQRRREGVQHRHPPLPQEHPGRIVRLREARLLRGTGRGRDGADGGVLRPNRLPVHHRQPRTMACTGQTKGGMNYDQQ